MNNCRENELERDFLSFDWSNEMTSDRIYRLNDNKEAHFVVSWFGLENWLIEFLFKIYKEEKEAYDENTDEPTRKCFNISLKHSLHLLNLIPYPIRCSIDVTFLFGKYFSFSSFFWRIVKMFYWKVVNCIIQSKDIRSLIWYSE